jgi:hypothetical protein
VQINIIIKSTDFANMFVLFLTCFDLFQLGEARHMPKAAKAMP